MNAAFTNFPGGLQPGRTKLLKLNVNILGNSHETFRHFIAQPNLQSSQKQHYALAPSTTVLSFTEVLANSWRRKASNGYQKEQSYASSVEEEISTGKKVIWYSNIAIAILFNSISKMYCNQKECSLKIRTFFAL